MGIQIFASGEPGKKQGSESFSTVLFCGLSSNWGEGLGAFCPVVCEWMGRGQGPRLLPYLYLALNSSCCLVRRSALGLAVYYSFPTPFNQRPAWNGRAKTGQMGCLKCHQVAAGRSLIGIRMPEEVQLVGDPILLVEGIEISRVRH